MEPQPYSFKLGSFQGVVLYDADPVQAVETKKTLLAMCAEENALVFVAHFPFPGLGRVLQVAGAWEWFGLLSSWR